MAKNAFVKVMVGLGIVIILGLFAGFGGDYVGKYFEEKCNADSNIVGSCSGIPGLGCETFITEESCRLNGEGGCYWQQPYDQTCQDNKQMYFSIFAGVVGIITLISAYLIKHPIVGGGFYGGSVVSMIIALVVSWQNFNDLLRIGIIVVFGSILIFIAYKKFND